MNVQRAIDVCKKMSNGGEVLRFDVETISASQDADPSDVMGRLASEGLHTVEYDCPQYQAVSLSARGDNESIRRAAKFSGMGRS